MCSLGSVRMQGWSRPSSRHQVIFDLAFEYKYPHNFNTRQEKGALGRSTGPCNSKTERSDSWEWGEKKRKCLVREEVFNGGRKMSRKRDWGAAWANSVTLAKYRLGGNQPQLDHLSDSARSLPYTMCSTLSFPWKKGVFDLSTSLVLIAEIALLYLSQMVRHNLLNWIEERKCMN